MGCSQVMQLKASPGGGAGAGPHHPALRPTLGVTGRAGEEARGGPAPGPSPQVRLERVSESLPGGPPCPAEPLQAQPPGLDVIPAPPTPPTRASVSLPGEQAVTPAPGGAGLRTRGSGRPAKLVTSPPQPSLGGGLGEDQRQAPRWPAAPPLSPRCTTEAAVSSRASRALGTAIPLVEPSGHGLRRPPMGIYTQPLGPHSGWRQEPPVSQQGGSWAGSWQRTLRCWPSGREPQMLELARPAPPLATTREPRAPFHC